MPRSTILLTAATLLVFAVACGDAASTPTTEPTQVPAQTAEPFAATPENGRQVAQEFGCSACHSTDGNPGVGPTWKGLFQSPRPLADSTTVTADEAYIRRSILEPNANIVEGFRPGIMPADFSERLSDEQIAAVIVYIKSLE